MFYPKWLLRDVMSRFGSIDSSLKHEEKRVAGGLEPEKIEEAYNSLLPRLNNAMIDFMFATSELLYYNDRNRTIFRFLQRTMLELMQKVNKKEIDFTRIRLDIADFKESLKDVDYNEEYNGTLPDAFKNAYKYDYGFHNTNLLRDIANKISLKQERQINAFFPTFSYDDRSAMNAYEFLPAPQIFKELAEKKNLNIATHINTSMSHFISENKRAYYNRVAIGQDSKISNDVFDLMVYTVPLTVTVNSSNYGIAIKKELTNIRDYIKYVRSGGWVVLTIPFYRIGSLCTFLSKNLEDVKVFRATSEGVDYFKDCFGSVVIVGKRKQTKDREIDEDTYNYLRSLYHEEAVTSSEYDFYSEENADFKLDLPIDELPVKLFRTGQLDESQILKQGSSVSALGEFFSRQKLNSENMTAKRPLLPFNVGQIGLVLTSGCLDGVVDESGTDCHLIKGRIVKRTEFNSTFTTDMITETNTISNHVEINILLPDGTRKVLA